MDRISSTIYEERIQSEFIETFVNGNKAMQTELKVLCPNMIIPSNSSNEPYVIIHHGYFAEGTYHFYIQLPKVTLHRRKGTFDTRRIGSS